MNTIKQDLDIIKKYSNKDILIALIKTMGVINKVRIELEKCWNDDLWWPSEIMVDIVPKLFSLKESYVDVGDEVKNDIYVCKLCGKEVNIHVPNKNIKYTHNWRPDYKNPMHGHLKYCPEILQIEQQSSSLEEFRTNILKVIH